MRRIAILTTFVALACGNDNQNEKLSSSLYKETVIPRDQVTIEFIDSTSYLVCSRADSVTRLEKGIWRVEHRITGTYLIMDSSEMKLETLSDSVITFSRGEFTPRFVKVKK